jgi:acetylornithine deacetylase
MNLFELVRSLVDIESTTGNEVRVGEFLADYLELMAASSGGRVERQVAEGDRFNVLATWGAPIVTLSTHMDTVPPHFDSSDDSDFIYGRGACDAKGIIAAMIEAAKKLLHAGRSDFGLLFVVGEEKTGIGASVAARTPRGSKFIICGEPTENKPAVGSKGSLRYEIIAEGKMAHSAYPELGESAIEKLLDALSKIRAIPMPVDGHLGSSTLNIGTIEGGRAPNVIADHAKAEIMIRLVSDATPMKAAVVASCQGLAEARELLCTPAVRLQSIDGMPTMVAAFTTDVPNFGDAWGKPYLIGPGSIHVAHTLQERVPKTQLIEAVGIYERMVLQFSAK